MASMTDDSMKRPVSAIHVQFSDTEKASYVMDKKYIKSMKSVGLLIQIGGSK